MQQQLEAVGALQAVVQIAASTNTLQYSSSGSGDADNNGVDSIGATLSVPSGVRPLLAVEGLPAAVGGGTFGPTPLLHFVYKLSGRQQYVMSPFASQLVEGGLQQVGGLCVDAQEVGGRHSWTGKEPALLGS